MLEIGIQTWGTDAAALSRYWALADELGFARIVYGDGLGAWTLDGWTALGALAVSTRRARIGPAVTYAFDRAAHHPSWLAKRAATLDHLSNGRAELRIGIGAADAATARGWRQHGIPYPDGITRVAMAEEAVQVVRALWTGDEVHHIGAHWRVEGAVLAPVPIQKPGPPVWIAAMGPAALAAAARCADGWEASYVSPAEFARRWSVVRGHLEAAGRDASLFGRSVELDVVLAPLAGLDAKLEAFCAARRVARDDPLLDTVLAGDEARIAARIADYAAAGGTALMLSFADFPATRTLEAFARILNR